LCFYQSFFLADSEVFRNRHLRVAAKYSSYWSLIFEAQEQAAQGAARADDFIWFFRLLAGPMNISLERFEVGVQEL
jgi:hypothetical protein